MGGRAVDGDEAAQKQFSAVITGPPPGSGIETRNDDERDLASQMQLAGKSSAEIQSALDQKRKKNDDRTAEARRNVVGTATASVLLSAVNGPWLGTDVSNDKGAAVPAQVAEKLVGHSFASFRAFREAFWQAVASTSELARNFNGQNQARMLNGNAPFAPKSEGSSRGRVWELHHDPAIGQGGAVYDLSNITVVSPKQHERLHYGEEE